MNSGKSTLLGDLAGWAAAEGLRVEGFLSRAADAGRAGERGAAAYRLERLSDGVQIDFLERVTPELEAARLRASGAIPYRIQARAFETAASWIQHALSGADPLIESRSDLSTDPDIDSSTNSRPDQPTNPRIGPTRFAEPSTETRAVALPPVDLLVLDEFGGLEAAGGGHLQAWRVVSAAPPGIVVLSVRDGLVPDIEAAIGQRFDRILDASHPETGAALRTLLLEQRDWARIGLFGAGSGGFEWSVGSAVHAVRLPMRGLMLSSAQAAVMVFAGAGLGQRSRVVWVPFIAAGIKALSPAGNRVRPMIAITVQGLLFGASTRILGWNAVGIFLGGALVGSWATAQGFLLQYLLIGSDLLRAYDALVGWVQARWDVGLPGIALTLGIWFALWGLFAGSVALIAWRKGALPKRLEAALERGVQGLRIEDPAPTVGSAVARGIRDVLRPVFWIPVVAVVLILLSFGAPWERAFWIAARAATVGIVIFSLVRAFDFRGFIRWLRHRGHWGPAVAFERALRR